MRALGTRGVAITARGRNPSSFHLNMRIRFGSRPPVTTMVCSITGWLVRIYHRFCQAPVPYRPVSTPSVERAATWRNSSDTTNSFRSTTEVPQYEKSVEKRDDLEPGAKQVRLLCIISLFYLPISYVTTCALFMVRWYRSCIDASTSEDGYGHPESYP